MKLGFQTLSLIEQKLILGGNFVPILKEWIIKRGEIHKASKEKGKRIPRLRAEPVD